ncbi:chromatin accessibility complex protein 1 [Anopheles nili]|uniref:chromatin accessibility complex protein 1 n=1 Tax=Anopheles nili TaxID=185578 RepID=UPI00237C2B5C|nr:chromatin accessibility complex protein 1 [Anopheles nili]
MDNDRLTQLPMSRIRTVMKTSPDMGNINHEALFLMCRAAEMFIDHMAKGAHREGRKTLEYRDLAQYVEDDDKLEFLLQILPKKVTVKEYKMMMSKKPESDEDSETDEEESEKEEQDDDDVVEIVEDETEKAKPEDSEDSASSSDESNSVISIDSSSDEKENSKNVSNKKSPIKHKTGDSP